MTFGGPFLFPSTSDLHPVDIYSRKQRWKLVLAIVAMGIVGASLYYSNRIVGKIRDEERRKVELWAEAVKNRAELVNYTERLFDTLRSEESKRVELYATAQERLISGDLSDFTFVLKVVQENTSIPVIILDDDGHVKFSRNLGPGVAEDTLRLRQEIEAMAKLHKPIEIPVFGNEKQFLYYKDSKLFSELQQVMDGIIKSFISETVMNTASVPIIYTDATRRRVIEHGHIEPEVIADTALLAKRIAQMEAVNRPIEIDLGARGKQFIFYEESVVLTQLRYFPYVQLLIIGLFLLVGYALFSIFRNAEQNQVWVGMAKETAHQLGTPLSSLSAWTDMLKERGTDPATITEMRKDLERLEVITERFSKIGSAPELQPEKLYHVLRATVLYLRPRLPSRALIEVVTPDDVDRRVPLNTPLFSWVIENLIRNAIDAMKGEGSITIEIVPDGPDIHIDVTDTGHGIPSSRHRTVFQPGYTTKKRGWGLGLSLTKRIIEQYHGGRIFVKKSAPGKGTTFRITLRS